MRRIAVLTVAALVTAGTLGAPKAEARGGGAIAAGVIGGLAAGALLGAALSEAHAAPGYGYGRPAPVVRDDVEEVPVHRRPVRAYGEEAGYRPVGYGFRRDCDRPRGYGGW